MFIFLLGVIFSTDIPVCDLTHPNPFNCCRQNSEIDDETLSLIIGSISALAYDLKKGIGLSESNCYIAKYFRTNTTSGKKEFWNALTIFHANMPKDERLIGACNFLVRELTQYYQLKI